MEEKAAAVTGPTLGRGAQPLHRLVGPREMLEAGVDPDELPIDRHKHRQQRRDLRLQLPGQRELCNAPDKTRRTPARDAQALAPEHGTDQRDVARSRLHQRLPHRELRPHVPLSVRGPMRRAIRSQLARLGQRPRVAQVGLHPAAPRCVHGGEVLVCNHHLVA